MKNKNTTPKKTVAPLGCNPLIVNPLSIMILLITAAITISGCGCSITNSAGCITATEEVKMEGSWTKVIENAAFSPRDTAEDAVFNNKMWLSNGYYHGNVLHRDLYNSTDGQIWEKVSDATPYDGYAELAVYKNKLWAIKKSVWNSPDGLKWEQILAATPFGQRGYGELVVFKDKLWQLGSGSDVWNTTDGANWTCVTKNAIFGDRSATAVVVFDDKLWLMAGKTPGANTPPETGYKDITTHNDVWSSPDGINWTCVQPTAPWPPRQWCVAKVYRNHIWLIGGHDNVNSTNLGDVWYSADGVNWEQFISVNGENFSPRHEPTCYVYDDSLWVVAGNEWPVKNDVWRLTLPK